MTAKYDYIGMDYAELRKPDQRIAAIIERALGSARTVLNVGAGTGSYESADRSLIAVDPSREMIRQRSPTEEAGLREMRRVTRGPIVLLTFDPSYRPWLTE
jgi:hypothetical protein